MDPTGIQILLIDDSLADACLLRAHLNQARPDGFKLVHSKTADAGLEALRGGNFDCVFLDYMLGDDNGLDVLRSIRSSGNDVPVIAVSGNGTEQVAVESLKLGAQDYMVKGILTPEAVERALSNAMEKVELTRQLAERQQELESFAHVAAHDLRAPLASISLFVEWLRDRLADRSDIQTRAVFERVLSGTESMSRLLDSLLEYAEVGRQGKQLERVDLVEVATTTMANLAQIIQDANATVEVGTLPQVLGDQVALVQLFQNLTANAVKFRGERPPVVKIAAERDGNHWRVSVSDNGIGIEPAFRDQIFAPFRRLHTEREYEGSGIGLATCKRIVQQHGGAIWAESEVGAGTTFHVTLPAAHAQVKPPGVKRSFLPSACHPLIS